MDSMVSSLQEANESPLTLVKKFCRRRSLGYQSEKQQNGVIYTDRHGTYTPYKLWFHWDSPADLLTIACTFLLPISDGLLPALKIFMFDLMPEGALGRFEVWKTDGAETREMIALRQNLSTRRSNLTVDQIEDVAEELFGLCEKTYPLIYAVAQKTITSENALRFDIAETVGRA